MAFRKGWGFPHGSPVRVGFCARWPPGVGVLEPVARTTGLANTAGGG